MTTTVAPQLRAAFAMRFSRRDLPEFEMSTMTSPGRSVSANPIEVSLMVLAIQRRPSCENLKCRIERDRVRIAHSRKLNNPCMLKGMYNSRQRIVVDPVDGRIKLAHLGSQDVLEGSAPYCRARPRQSGPRCAGFPNPSPAKTESCGSCQSRSLRQKRETVASDVAAARES